MRLAAYALRALVFGLGAMACHEIAGIEDRTVEDLSLQICAEYCNEVLERCTGDYSVYVNENTCLGTCKYLPLGEANEPVTANNTVLCRLEQARGIKEPNVDCRRAGPGTQDACGTNCEAYCGVRAQLCPQEYEERECIRLCGGLIDRKEFNTETDVNGNTVQCRLWHIAAAAAAGNSPQDIAKHCQHARLIPQDPDDAPCADKPGREPSCEQYCKLSSVVCQGDNQVYESIEQCEKVCSKLVLGLNGDQTDNTVACRLYHTYNAMPSAAQAQDHCPHSGPGGDGHCGKDDPKTGLTANCASYCRLFEAACGEAFREQFGNDATCQAQCKDLPGAEADSFYSTKRAENSGNNLMCRLLYTSRALSDPSHCASAAGGGECR